MHVADADSLRAEATTLTAVVPELSRNQQVVYLNSNINTSIVGTTANYVSAHNYTITAGRNFTDGDDAARERYAVIGSDVPKLLNANPAALDRPGNRHPPDPVRDHRRAELQGRAGIPESRRTDPDSASTARYRVFGNDLLRSISVIVQHGVPLEQGMVDIERVLRKQHKIRPGQDDNFQIRSPKDILATQQQTAQTFSALLLGIAAVSLLVGGIGIMNIMLVSVTERTKEIGIRKALGATKLTIMLQFLVEALVLCVSGGDASASCSVSAPRSS